MDIRYTAKRLDDIPPYLFAVIGKRIRELEAQGHAVIRLDMGSPDMSPPPAVIEALYDSAQEPTHHGYGGFTGIPALRKAFAGYYARRFKVDLDTDTEVLPLLGSKEGIVNISLAILDPEDIVLVPDPGYPAYGIGAILAGAEPYAVRLVPEQDYLPDLRSIPSDVLKRARVLWINYPNNPTGAVVSKDDLAQIIAFCRDNQILLCSDNPYADVTFGGARPPSLLEVPGAKEIAVEFNSLSKIYNMAGWRVGVCVGNAAMIEALLRVKSNVDSGMFRAVQDAACLALSEVDEDWIAERNEVYRRRRDIVLEDLPQVGLSARPPQAGLYVWAAVDSGDDTEYARGALEEAHVSISPGLSYGVSGKGYVRFSLVTAEDRIREAMARLASWYAHRS